MGLQVAWNDVPMSLGSKQGEVVEGEPAVSKRTLGKKTELIVATRKPGYHSKPHVHDCEQLNWVIEGDLWIIVEEEAYHCRKGDLMRVPRNLTHWALHRGTEDCLLLETFTPANIKHVSGGMSYLFADNEKPEPDDPVGRTFIPNAEEFGQRVEKLLFAGAKAPNEREAALRDLNVKDGNARPSLLARWDEVPVHREGGVTTRSVYGNESQLSVVHLPPGYHPAPRIESSEQLVWLHKGDLWVFIGDQPFHMKQGDFLRIPANLVHWAWNRSGSECILVEMRVPNNLNGAAAQKMAMPLFRASETIKLTAPGTVTYPSMDKGKIDEIEARVTR